jgi:drug/metabolite transporter (DMT)-like permease
MGLVEWLLLIVLAAVWGSAFFFGIIALREVGPLTLVASRLVVATFALNLLLIATGQRLNMSKVSWKHVTVMGIIGVLVPFSMIFWAETRINSSLAAVLNATVPMFSVTLAHFIGSERLTIVRTLGALCGLLGVAVMIGLDVVKAGGEVVPQLAVLGAASLYAVSAFYGRRLRNIPPLVSSAGMVSVTTVLAIPIAVIIEKPWLRYAADGTTTTGWPNLETIGALLGLGLLCTAFAYALYFHMLARVGPSNALLSTYLIPVSAVLLGVLVLDERLLPQHFAGMALIASGLVLIDGRILARLRGSGTAPTR